MNRVPVGQISLDRLRDWLNDCKRDATPIALIAVGHDEHSGEIHVYRTEDGPSGLRGRCDHRRRGPKAHVSGTMTSTPARGHIARFPDSDVVPGAWLYSAFQR